MKMKKRNEESKRNRIKEVVEQIRANIDKGGKIQEVEKKIEAKEKRCISGMKKKQNNNARR